MAMAKPLWDLARTPLGSTEFWRGSAGSGWATGAALVVLLLSHLLLLLRRSRRRPPISGVSAAATAADTSTIITTTTSTTTMINSSSTRIKNLICDSDLRELITSLGGNFRERDKWEHIISKKNDNLSYCAWCENKKDGPPRYLSVTTFERCSTELLRDFYMDNEYRKEWDNTVMEHEQLQFDDNSGTEIGQTIKKFPFLTPREYILAWRVWETDDKSFYCFIKDCEHPFVPRQRKYVRVRFFRSGWRIRKISGREACEITVVHQEDNNMNIEMAKLAFSKGIWSYVCKMDNALRQYSPQHRGLSRSILTMQRLIKKVPLPLEADVDMQISQGLPRSTTQSAPSRNPPDKEPVKRKKDLIANGLLLLGSIVCVSRGHSNLGAQLAMAFFLKKAFKQEQEPGLARSTGVTHVRRDSRHSH